MVMLFDSVLWHHFDKFYWTLDPIREPSPDEEEGSMRYSTRNMRERDDEETEADLVQIRSGENQNNEDGDRRTSADTTDSIPPPSSRLIKRPSIFELLVENENEYKQQLREVEMREASKRKSRFSVIMSSSTFPPYIFFIQIYLFFHLS